MFYKHDKQETQFLWIMETSSTEGDDYCSFIYQLQFSEQATPVK